MRHYSPVLSRFCVLTALAGTAFAANAQNTDQPTRKDNQTTNDGSPRTADGRRHDNDRLVFVSGDKLRGKSVYNSNKENLGSIDDLIIDRGSGQIAYLILKTGTTLGMGGKLVVAPYSSFGWDQVEKQVTLDTTPADIKAWPEFQKTKWAYSGRDQSTLTQTLAHKYYKNYDDSNYPTGKLADDEHLSGTIKDIHRKPMTGGPEEIVVTVSGKDGQNQDVVVGPSWYVAGNSLTFYREAPVEMKIVRIDQNGEKTTVARSVSMNSSDVPLYDDKGVPNWSSKSTDSKHSLITSPFVLSRDLVGKRVDCRGEKCGKVNDLLVEAGSGNIAFLSVDPDQNILGIGDTKRLVPWSVVSNVSSDTVMVDASKSMIVNAPQVPSDLKTLGMDNAYQAPYKNYQVEPPTFHKAADQK